MSLFDLINAIYLSLVYKLKLKDPLKIIDDMVGWVEGLPEKTMVDLCSEVSRKVLLPSVYQAARSEIKIHKEKNAKVVILSSALTPLCQEAAKDLEMDDIICSDLEVKNGYYTGCSHGRLCFGEEKAARLMEYCEKNNSTPGDAWYYSDSISDLPVLNAVGHPVCIILTESLGKSLLITDGRSKNGNRGFCLLSYNELFNSNFSINSTKKRLPVFNSDIALAYQ